jgi:hypothetical protein
MNLKKLVRVCSAVVSYGSFGIILLGFIAVKKAVNELKVRKVVQKETEAIFEK